MMREDLNAYLMLRILGYSLSQIQYTLILDL